MFGNFLFQHHFPNATIFIKSAKPLSWISLRKHILFNIQAKTNCILLRTDRENLEKMKKKRAGHVHVSFLLKQKALARKHSHPALMHQSQKAQKASPQLLAPQNHCSRQKSEVEAQHLQPLSCKAVHSHLSKDSRPRLCKEAQCGLWSCNSQTGLWSCNENKLSWNNIIINNYINTSQCFIKMHQWHTRILSGKGNIIN